MSRSAPFRMAHSSNASLEALRAVPAPKIESGWHVSRRGAMQATKSGTAGIMMFGSNRFRGRTAVCAVVIVAALLLVASARWIAGPTWPQIMADLVE